MKCPICAYDAGLAQQSLYDDRYGYKGFFDVYRCSFCAHTFLDVRLEAEEIGDLYTKYYTRKSISELRMPQFGTFKAWLDGVADVCQYVKPGSKVLDIGCGSGENLLYLKSIGCEAIGSDADQNLAALAEKYKLNIRIGMFAPSAFDEGGFDYVIMNQLIEHMPNPLIFLQSVKTLLKPTGKVILATPNIEGWGRKIWGKRWLHWHAPYHVTFFSSDSLEKTIALSGFKMEKKITKTSSNWFYFQLRHALFYPEPGETSIFWKDELRKAKILRRIQSKLITVLYKFKVGHLITRIFDALGIGDNMTIILSRIEP